MPFILFFLMLLSPAFAVDVTTLDSPKTGSELMLITTSETTQQQIEKQFVANQCRVRVGLQTIREYFFAKNCRATVIQFLLNQGYKPDSLFQTFTK